jgi:hypothetical protein
MTSTKAYIYTTGTITSNPTPSCTKNVNAANPNCNITLTINAPSIYPSQILIKKDGYDWRLQACRSSACNETIVDTNPRIGIHTYTLHNSADGSRLSRTTVFIAAGVAITGAPTPTPCSGCPASTGILEVCHPTEVPTQVFSCNATLALNVGENVQLHAWQNLAGDRINWVDITNFVKWQACNNNSTPCNDSWFLAPGLFEARAAGGPMPINAIYGGISDQINMNVY